MKMKNWSAVFLVMVLLMCFTFPSGQALAASKLEVDAKIGINGKMKMSTSTPLSVTIKNTGDTFEGDFVINAAYTYEAAAAQVIPLALAQGEEKTFEIFLTGLTDLSYSEGDLFSFYEGGIKKGKKVEYKGTKKVMTNMIDSSVPFIFTYTPSSDRLSSYLKLSQFSPNNGAEIVHLQQLKDYVLPEDAKGLAMANIIVFDEIAIADFSEQQQQALYDWVQQGGTIVVGAMNEIERAAGIFKEDLPLQLQDSKQKVTIKTLEDLTNGGIFTASIDIWQSTLKQGATLALGNNANVLAAEKSLGSGRIIQTTFSLGDQPLASMDGYTALTAKMLNFSQYNTMNSYVSPPLEQITYGLRSVNELFPSFQVSMSFLLIAIIIYIAVIGPLLYFILKKLDKREHAWWLIPLLSVIVSIALFVIGAQGRIMQPQAQQSAIYKVNDDSSLNGYYLQSILTNRSGDFVAHTDKATTAIALRNYNNFGSDTNLAEHAYVQEHAEGSTLTMRNLNYWSVQSFIGQSTVRDVGKMDIDLTLKNGKLVGTIQNNFSFALNDVTLQTGMKKIKLGQIEANGVLQVEQDIKVMTLQQPFENNNYGYSQPQNKEEINPMRIESLQNMTLGALDGDMRPVISAWAEQALVGVELESGVNMSGISYFIQPFSGKTELTGPFVLKQGNFDYDVYSQMNGYYEASDKVMNTWYLENGVYDLYVTLPEDFTAFSPVYEELKVTNKDTVKMKVAIWNNKKEQFEPFEQKVMIYTDNIDEYMSATGEMRFQLTFDSANGDMETTLPSVELKGVSNQ